MTDGNVALATATGPIAPAAKMARATPFKNWAIVRFTSRLIASSSCCPNKNSLIGEAEDFGDKFTNEGLMKATVNRLSAELTTRYVHYLETFLVDLWSDVGQIEFRCGFTLRVDHQLRQFTLKLPALDGDTDEERDMMIVIIFEQIEDMIDDAIAERRADAN
ncbi:hypothetical protein N8D56_26235 (plasmid) [Devosia sp. A8/3-2]|nr:hypothetical protein N8D56_26235 [Devosia sp. A8/3-2]